MCRLGDYSDYVPEELLREVKEFEESARVRGVHRKRRYPSDRDVAEAVKAVAGGYVSRHTLDHLYESVKRYLEERGFDVSAMSESRFWRVVTAMVRRGELRKE